MKNISLVVACVAFMPLSTMETCSAAARPDGSFSAAEADSLRQLSSEDQADTLSPAKKRMRRINTAEHAMSPDNRAVLPIFSVMRYVVSFPQEEQQKILDDAMSLLSKKCPCGVDR